MIYDGERVKLVALFDASGRYSDRVSVIEKLLDAITERWGIQYKLLYREEISPSLVKQFENQIRCVAPQIRGRIVASGHHILPLSRNKNLNLTNTPIILFLEDDETPVYVLPHLLGTAYFDVEESLKRMLATGPRFYLEARGLLEDPLKKILVDDPSIIETNLRLMGLDVECGTGIVDVVFEDSEKRVIVVEIETHARENAVTQVLRLASGYASGIGKTLDQIRKAIVCRYYDDNVCMLCRELGIELYKVELMKVI